MRVIAGIAALILLTGCFTPTPVQYDFAPAQSGATLDCRAGDLITVTLPVNGDTSGLFWREAKPVNPNVLIRTDIVQGKAENLATKKMEKVIQYRYRVTNGGFAGISLEYSDRHGSQVRDRFDLLVRAEGKPVQLEDLFKDGPPPETMTDSKGNVVEKPRHLLDPKRTVLPPPPRNISK